MGALRVYAIASVLAIVALSFNLASANRRIATLERQIAGPTPAETTTTQASRPRTWRASNGVVLSADDLARAEATDDRAAKAAAELEYLVLGPGSRR